MKINLTKNKFKKLKLTSLLTTISIFLMNIRSYATKTSIIGAQEVETATQNVKDAVIKLAMPVWSCL